MTDQTEAQAREDDEEDLAYREALAEHNKIARLIHEGLYGACDDKEWESICFRQLMGDNDVVKRLFKAARLVWSHTSRGALEQRASGRRAGLEEAAEIADARAEVNRQHVEGASNEWLKNRDIAGAAECAMVAMRIRALIDAEREQGSG